jgi:hypothetical protein
VGPRPHDRRRPHHELPAGNNKHFGDNCQALCEEACQGPGSIGCRLVHEKYCGVGSEQQNDLAELHYIFGTNEPDTSRRR